MRIELAFRTGSKGRIDVSPFDPGSVLRMPLRRLEHQPVRIANVTVPLGEICSVHQTMDKPDELFFSGETQRLIRVGHSMKGGNIIVEGSAGDELGIAMSAGRISVHGDVGDWCGAREYSNSTGMRGGTIFVEGNAGDQVGAGMKRGVIFVSKNAGQYAGARMGAGTILCGGGIGLYPGLGMKRGSLIAQKAKAILPGFLAAGNADGEWLRICFSDLRRSGIQLPPRWLQQNPMRFTGDHLEMGKGEILIYDPLE